MSQYYTQPSVQGSPLNEAAFNQAAGGAKDAFTQRLKGKQSAQLAQLEALLKGKGTEADIQRAKDALSSGDLPEGASVKVGDVSVGQDPLAKNQMKMFQTQKSEGQALSNEFGKIGKKYEPILDRLDSATGGLARGDALGLKQAAVGLAGVTEGPSQRLLGSVIQSFGGDPSIVGQSDKLANFVDGLQRSGKSDGFKQGMQQALQHSYEATKAGYGADKADFTMRAGQLAPYTASSNPQALSQFGGGIEAKIARVGDNFKQLGQIQQQAQQQPSVQDPGPLDKLKAFFNRPATPTVPVPPPGAMDIDSWMKSQGGP